MAKIYLGNSFSLNMLAYDEFTLIRARKVNPDEVPADAVSVIGHADTARVVSGILGREIPANRVNVALEDDDILYVAQYKGPRLEEGATKLPEGATLEFVEITLQPNGCGTCPAVNCEFCTIQDWTHGC